MIVILITAVTFIVTFFVLSYLKQKPYRDDMMRIRAYKISNKNLQE